MNKTLVVTKESAGAVIRRCSVSKVFFKKWAKFTVK